MEGYEIFEANHAGVCHPCVVASLVTIDRNAEIRWACNVQRDTCLSTHEPQQEQQMISRESSLWAMPWLMRKNEVMEPVSLLLLSTMSRYIGANRFPAR
jgi:hypothetical protein